MLYRGLVGPLLFSMSRKDPERAHSRAMVLMTMVGKFPPLLQWVRRYQAGEEHTLAREVFGIRFPNPLGLAAGFDKDGVALPALAALGFGFLEVGTVTWHAQPGNPRPRIFRLPAARALINRMGFNNAGAAAMASRLAAAPPFSIPIGISVGKSRDTPTEQANADYCASVRMLAPRASFLTINVSSPNTPGLRSLQERAQLEALLRDIRHTLALQPAAPPLLVKIAPDLSESTIAAILEVCLAHHVQGIIATNTMPVGPGTAHPECEAGGLSGAPLAERARRIVQFISRETAGRLPIIGVGGITSSDDALRMLDAGASLIQIYTGLIYEGPGLIRAIHRHLRATTS